MWTPPTQTAHNGPFDPLTPTTPNGAFYDPLNGLVSYKLQNRIKWNFPDRLGEAEGKCRQVVGGGGRLEAFLHGGDRPQTGQQAGRYQDTTQYLL